MSASRREHAKREKLILSLNSGSSSRKLSLFRVGPAAEELVAEGAAENVGQRNGRVTLRDSSGKKLVDRAVNFAEPERALRQLLDGVNRAKISRPDAIGHRIVHGGPDHTSPERATRKLIGE
ncbi:MAG TPA: hypothetical protein VEJ86_00645, partial [Candidatus Binataceae bacterium]|nr:hypothetical protein [Candidatus Binataceae bacterium]